MARGNDAVAAAEELRKQTGGVSGNAEQEIQNWRRLYTPLMRANAQKRFREDVATSLDDEKVEKAVGGKLAEQGAWSVRGTAIFAVCKVDEDDDEGLGHTVKVAVDLDDVRGAKSSGDASTPSERSEAPASANAKERAAAEKSVK